MSLLASGYSGGVSATMYWCLCTMQKLCNRKRQVAVSVPCPATGINHEVDVELGTNYFVLEILDEMSPSYLSPTSTLVCSLALRGER